uniref:Uncharacterized protein n=1 Tax=Rhizophora mucronata TaxID=61149 RepID=A0A2P2PBH8_RHIMU
MDSVSTCSTTHSGTSKGGGGATNPHQSSPSTSGQE